MRIKQYEDVLTKEQCDDIIKASKFVSVTNIPNNQVYNADFYVQDPEIKELLPLVSIFKKYSEEYDKDLQRSFMNVMEYVDGLGSIVRHQDTNDPDPSIPRRNFTIMVYLNDGFEDGETVFFENDEELIVEPKPGRLLIIPGDVQHEARTPRGKNKYIALARYNVSQ